MCVSLDDAPWKNLVPVIRVLRVRLWRTLARWAAKTRPPSPCQIRDWCNHPRCDGDSCPACGTWERPTGRYRPPTKGTPTP